MKIFKFGGASVKDAQAVKNVSKIVKEHGEMPLVVVISAMGKTTNHLEDIISTRRGAGDVRPLAAALKEQHAAIIAALECTGVDALNEYISQQVDEMCERLEKAEINDRTYDRVYDDVIHIGELISTRIVASWMQQQGINCQWADARDYIKTNEQHREALINWEATQQRVDQGLRPLLEKHIIVTQGFIGSTEAGATTTLGREGSDFTAAIFATCLKAKDVTIWKDVPGILNADPKLVKNTFKYDHLSYEEAAEMTYYGASVIHPKTIKPLAGAKIPLLVRSFEDPEKRGTRIHDIHVQHQHPAIIFKRKQCLISFHMRDFAFVNEKNLSQIFQAMDELNIKINVMQNSAISFSVCVDEHPYKIEQLMARLEDHFSIFRNNNLSLITIKNYDQQTMADVIEDQEVLLEQRSRTNVQVVVRTPPQLI